MRRLWIDYESRSRIKLKQHGLDVYAKHLSTEPLMLAYAFDEEEPKLWKIWLGEPMPEDLRAGFLDSNTLKCAWNFNFEKDITEFRIGIRIPLQQWFDPSILCAYMSLPIGLDRASKALGLVEKKIHQTGAKRGIKLFSEPTKQLKRVLKKDPNAPADYFKDWNTHPEDWQIWCDYCLQDVRAEREAWHAAVAYACPMTEEEFRAWQLDQRMNERGVYIDEAYVTNAKKLAEAEADEITFEIKANTGLDNPNSRDQLLGWLQERGYPYDSLDKEHVDEALKHRQTLKPLVVQILELKKKLGGSAYKKLESILDRMGIDKRLRDQFIYHGAHTGRWAGRGVQLQNLFKPDRNVTAYDWGKKVPDSDKRRLDIYTRAIRLGKKLYTPFTPMNLVASTIRSAFIATPGYKLDVGDLAQIESRVLACLARCTSMMDAYAAGRDLYKECMARQLCIPMDEVTSAMRDKGKIQILGCGFGMGWEKFIDFAATAGMTLNEKEAKECVYGFRETYPEIPNLWKEFNTAVIRAVKSNICVYVKGCIVDGRNPKVLKIKLPSGRCLHYFNPYVNESMKFGRPLEQVSYTQYDSKGTKISDLYGGLIVENVVQAIARDILLNGMFEAEKEGFIVIMTIHDEIVCESPTESKLNLDKLLECMARCPWWATEFGFVLKAEGYEGFYYKK
jgi:DNA polymerase bacteriophage-type